jgi:hypothetical protein
MQAKPTRVSRTDGLDAQRFQAMIESESFARYRERLEAVLARERTDLETVGNETEMRRAQGAVAALRTALGLPAIILAQMKADSTQRR